MSRYKSDMFNIKMALLEAEAEEEYWRNQEEEDNKRYKEYEEKELRKNAKKTCNFCNEFGHVVFQMGILTCPLLKQTACSACGLIGHTPKFCMFLQKSDNTEINITEYVEFHIFVHMTTNTNTWANKVVQNIKQEEKTKMIDDCVQSCKRNIDKYNKKQAVK